MFIIFFFFWISCSNHCLAALDLGPDVEQPFDCPIVQNRQAVQSMRRSMDSTLKDNMVDGLFLCATLTDSRGGHTPFVQTWAQTSDTGAETVKPDPGFSLECHSGGLVPGMKMRSLVVVSLVGLSAHPPFHWWSAQCAARMLLSDELMSCCATSLKGVSIWSAVICSRWQVSAGWSRCPGSMARPARDSVAPMRRSSADWMPARIGRLSANVGRSHPVTIRKASLMAGSIKRVRHQTGAQYPADECTRARVAIRRVVAPAPQPEPASQERDAWCQLLAKWLEVSAISERPVQRYSEVFGLEAEGQDFVDEVDFQLTFGFLDVKMEGCRHRFSRAELYLPCLEVFTYGCHVLAQYPFHRLPISINMHDY